MNTSTTARYASLLAVGLWAAKAIAIGVAGGLGQSPVEDPLFFAGLLSCLIAVGAVAVSLTARRSLPLRVGAVVAGVIAAGVVAAALNAVVQRITESEHWAWTELNLWLTAVAVLALAWGPRARAAVAAKSRPSQVR